MLPTWLPAAVPAPLPARPALPCPAVVDDLMARGIAEESDGAKCVFIEVSPGLTWAELAGS